MHLVGQLLTSILLPFSHLRFSLPTGLLGFPTKTLCAFTYSPVRVTSAFHHPLLHMMNRITFGEQQKKLSSSLLNLYSLLYLSPSRAQTASSATMSSGISLGTYSPLTRIRTIYKEPHIPPPEVQTVQHKPKFSWSGLVYKNSSINETNFLKRRTHGV